MRLDKERLGVMRGAHEGMISKRIDDISVQWAHLESRFFRQRRIAGRGEGRVVGRDGEKKPQVPLNSRELHAMELP